MGILANMIFVQNCKYKFSSFKQAQHGGKSCGTVERKIKFKEKENKRMKKKVQHGLELSKI